MNQAMCSDESIRKMIDEEFARRKPVEHKGADYASTFLFCKIYASSPSHTHGRDAYKVLNVVPLFKYDRDPEILLNRFSDNPSPGLCWSFKGSKGFVTLQLHEPMKINEVVYTHVSRNAEPEGLAESAPRVIQVWVGFCGLLL